MKKLIYIAIVILATACQKEVLQPVRAPRVIDTVYIIRFNSPANLDSLFKHHKGTYKDSSIIKHK